MYIYTWKIVAIKYQGKPIPQNIRNTNTSNINIIEIKFFQQIKNRRQPTSNVIQRDAKHAVSTIETAQSPKYMAKPLTLAHSSGDLPDLPSNHLASCILQCSLARCNRSSSRIKSLCKTFLLLLFVFCVIHRNLTYVHPQLSDLSQVCIQPAGQSPIRVDLIFQWLRLYCKKECCALRFYCICLYLLLGKLIYIM